MKFKSLWLSIVMILWAATAFAVVQIPTLDFGQATVNGSTVSFPVTLTNIQGTSISSLGLEIGFDSSVFEVIKNASNKVISATVGAAATAASKSVSQSNPSAGILKIGIVDFNDVLAIGDGVVAQVSLTIKNSSALGQFTITNKPDASDPAANPVTITGSNTIATIADTTAPTVIFTAPAIANSLNVNFTAFTANDNSGSVAGYMVKESPTKPLASDGGWSGTAPQSKQFTSYGSKTLYAWAKDSAGNVSDGVRQDIAVSDGVLPQVTAFNGVPALTKTRKLTGLTVVASDDSGSVVGYMINESAAAPLAGAAGWNTSAPAGYDITTAGDGLKNLYAWAKDGSGNVSLSQSAQVTLDSTAPLLTVDTPTDAIFTNSLVVNVSGSVSDDGSGLADVSALTVNGSDVAVNAGIFNTAVNLLDGSNDITIVATDKAGNKSTVTRKLTYDAAKPSVTITAPADGSKTKEQTLTLTGAISEPATSIDITINTDPSQNVALNNATTFSRNITLNVGSNVINVVAYDLAQNKSTTATRTVYYDNTVPSLAITDPPQDSMITTSNSYTVLGTMSDNDVQSVTLELKKQDGTLVQSLTVPVANGSFQQSVAFPTDTTTYSIFVTATDGSGNSSTTQRNIIYDTTTPVLSMGSTQFFTKENSFTIGGTKAIGSSITVNCNNATGGSVAASNNPVWTMLVTGLSKTTVCTVNSPDSTVGGKTLNITITYDTTPPVVDPLANKSANAQFSQTATATDANAMTYAWTKQAGPGAVTFGSATAKTTTISAIEEGTYTLRFTATDAAGNSSFTDMTLIWDTTAPTLAISNPSGTVTSGGKIDYTVTYNNADNITLSNGNVLLNNTGTANGTVTVSGTGNTRTVTIANITGDGTLGIRLAAGTASDLAGNVTAASAPSATFIVDKTPPSVSAGGDKTKNSQFTQAATATDATALTYSWSQQSGPGTITFGSLNALSTTMSASADGVYTVRFTATDAAGNSSSSDMKLTWDTTAPIVTIGAPSLLLTGKSSILYPVTFSNADTITLAVGNVTLIKTGTANGIVSSVTGTGNSRTVTVSGITGDGTLRIKIAAGTAANLAGNQSPETGESAKTDVDNTAPALTVTALADGAVTSNQTLTISGSVTDINGISNLSVNGGANVSLTNDAFNTAVTLANGANTIAVTAVDAAGNKKTDSRTIVYDKTAPVISFAGQTPASGSVINQQNIIIAGTLNEPGVAEITANGGTPVTVNTSGNQNSFSTQVSLTAGQNTINVKAFDIINDGTRNSSTVSRTVTLDMTNPILAITDPAQDITTTYSSYAVKGTATDNFNNAVTLSLSVDGVAVTPAPVTTGVNGDFQQPVEFSNGKSYAIKVTATDAAGNSSTSQRNIVYRPLELGDALKALRIAVGLDTKTDSDAILDVAPLTAADKPDPDGVIDIGDAVILLRRVVGLVQW